MVFDPAAVAQSPVLQANLKHIGKALISAPGPKSVSPRAMLQNARKLRDEAVWNYPVLPGAILVFQQLTAGREWVVSGKIRAANRGVEFLNETRTVSQSGMVYTGFQEYLQRRALDYILVGRTAFRAPRKKGEPIEYLDPTYLRFEREAINETTNQRKTGLVRSNEKCWAYNSYEQERYHFDEVFLFHPIPIGANDLFLAPIAPILPTAMLSWLVREHDTAATDGRKIRDILIAGTDHVRDAIATAIGQAVALYAGVDPTQVGVPIVTVNNMSGIPVKDMVHWLGISNIPESFDRELFEFDYVNQISAVLGLALRHFWNSEKTTNRALEEIQEQRQMQKGPSFVVRTEQRQINSSGVLKQFGATTRMGFIEEVDTASQKVNAEVLKLTAEALEKVAQVFQASLSLEALLAWMQSIRVLPNELELITTEGSGNQVINADDNARLSEPNEGTTDSDPSPIALDNRADSSKKGVLVPDYDEVTVNQHGQVVERRFKLFTVVKHLAEEIKAKQATEPPAPDPEAAFEMSVLDSKRKTVDAFCELWSSERSLDDIQAKMPVFNRLEIAEAVGVALNGGELTDGQYTIIDHIVGCLSPALEEVDGM